VALAAAPEALVSIIVPVFNEAATVAAVVERLLTIEFPGAREIIVINDGSTDGTRAALDRIPPNPALQVVHLDRNRGKGYAVRQGFARARGSVIAIQDADLELDPAQLPNLVGPVLRGEADVVYGSRFLRSTSAPFMTIAGNRLLTALTNVLFGSSLTDMETCYKVMRGDVARALVLSADRFDIEPEITARLLLAGHRIVERPVRFDARSRMAGKKMRWRDGWMALRVLIAERLRGFGASRM
jgi:glycosyltransferase involved in cell wall biosynthesis